MTARSIVRNTILDILGSFSKPSSYIHILNGHMISRGDGTEADRNKFERLLTHLSSECDFVNIEDAITMIVNHQTVDRPTIAFTFDDGFEDCYTHIAPALEKFGINAMFFINPGFADAANHNEEYIKHFTEITTESPGKRPMSWKQIKELQQRGFKFGAHTIDHYMINDNNQEELEHQIADCKKMIEEQLQTPCDYFAFPYGRLEHANPLSIDIACQCYKYVFSQSDHRHFFSYNGKVINRRHFEAWWPLKHVKYFISCKRT